MAEPMSASPRHLTFVLCFSHEVILDDSLFLHMLVPSPSAFLDNSFSFFGIRTAYHTILEIPWLFQKNVLLSLSFCLALSLCLSHTKVLHYMSQYLNKNETINPDLFDVNNCVFLISMSLVCRNSTGC